MAFGVFWVSQNDELPKKAGTATMPRQFRPDRGVRLAKHL